MNNSLYCIHRIVLIHSSIHGRLGCFHFLAVVHNAAMNMSVQTHDHIPAFDSFGCILRSGIDGSHSYFIYLLGGAAILFHSGCTILHPTNSIYKGSNFIVSSTMFSVFISFNKSHPDGCEVLGKVFSSVISKGEIIKRKLQILAAWFL